MDNPEHVKELIIGKDISWEDAQGQGFRIKHFTPFAIIEAGKIKRTSVSMPYASLLVESPTLPQEATIYVYVDNKVDFCNLWEVFKDRGISPKEEVLIDCKPFYRNWFLNLLNPTMPRLHIYIYPKGHLEELHDPNTTTDQFLIKPVAKWIPKYYRD